MSSEAMQMDEVRLAIPDAVYEQARLKLERSRWAAAKMRKLPRKAVVRIVDAVAEAAHSRAQHYAEWAVRETGMGVVAHKRMKNEACSKGLVQMYGGEDFVGPRIDVARKIVELPRPAGVIFALIPVTNPVATVYFKAIMALMTRNAIVLSPHPGAREVCADAARLLSEAACVAGAPDGVIQVIDEPTIPLIERLIADERVDLVVATGGPAVVRAAYRSGNPAMGVGPGNAPVVVDDSADLHKAAQRIVASKSFDNSILCTNESTLLAFDTIADTLLAAMKAEGAHVCSAEETAKLRSLLFTPQGFNTAMIGKDAAAIARAAGFAATGAKILVAPVEIVQPVAEDRIAVSADSRTEMLRLRDGFVPVCRLEKFYRGLAGRSGIGRRCFIRTFFRAIRFLNTLIKFFIFRRIFPGIFFSCFRFLFFFLSGEFGFLSHHLFPLPFFLFGFSFSFLFYVGYHLR